ncbi:putative myosin regulatory light chain [Cardiosporidium cionae]|uniref:Myosin regulatory light chain n=1 Tax=Cardiosporidium cionae TaxID=476202 RepID=A0ABQ7JCZ4_9APIC|nr:putative myosin regulatory light chain [Cardiosporidium cionae]|eukprot:KAF8821887.1 putative myosin regulatory light chain [Cardiosporidium cionae]
MNAAPLKTSLSRANSEELQIKNGKTPIKQELKPGAPKKSTAFSTKADSKSQPKALRKLHSNDDSNQIALSCEQFFNIFINNYKQPTNEKTLLEAFIVFDPENSGKISADKFTEILTTRGEPFSQEEAREILQLVDAKSKEKFDYTDLVRKLISGPQHVRSV